MTHTVDKRVADLAAELLDEHPYRNQKHLDSLAAAIQQATEDWFEDFDGMLAEPPHDRKDWDERGD